MSLDADLSNLRNINLFRAAYRQKLVRTPGPFRWERMEYPKCRITTKLPVSSVESRLIDRNHVAWPNLTSKTAQTDAGTGFPFAQILAGAEFKADRAQT